jgi:hypothetical protein
MERTMNPFFLLLAMYAGFAALLLTSGYIYKTTRDRRNKEKELQRKLDFERRVEEPKPETHHTTLVAR